MARIKPCDQMSMTMGVDEKSANLGLELKVYDECSINLALASLRKFQDNLHQIYEDYFTNVEDSENNVNINTSDIKLEISTAYGTVSKISIFMNSYNDDFIKTVNRCIDSFCDYLDEKY